MQNWATWAFLKLLDHGHPLIHSHFNSLLIKLIGSALIHLSCKDAWGWGSSGVYSAALGYQVLHSNLQSSLSAKFWKSVWQSPSIPKVNFCTWILMHQRALTGENLLKRGFASRFRCCFCKKVAETSKHIFFGCDFTQKAWTHILSGLSVSAPSIYEPVNLFANWQLRYPRISSINHAWKKIWQAIPKFFGGKSG